VTDTNLYETRRNFFNIEENCIQINNKTDSVIAEKVSKNVHVLTFGEKSENMTVTVSCNAALQFISTVSIFTYVHVTQEFGDSLHPGSDVHMNRKSSYTSTDLFVEWITQYFLKHKFSAKVILHSDGHRTHCRLSHTACLKSYYEVAGVDQKQVLGAFAKLRKATINFVMTVRLSVPPSLRPHGTTRFTPDGFS